MELSAAIEVRVDEVLKRLRAMVGDAWLDPVRIHLDLRAKRRSGVTDYAVTVSVQFPTRVTVVIIEGFGEGAESWTIRST